MLNVSIFPDFGAGNSSGPFDAMKSGIVATGDKYSINDMDADVAVIWSVLFAGRMAGNEKVYKHFREQGKPVVVMEVGGLSRNFTWRVGINNINRSATFPTPDPKFPRWKIFNKPLQDWKKDGEFVVIATQRPDSLQWKGMPPVEQWAEEVVENVRKYSDRPIVVRPHPRDKITDWDFINSKVPGLYYDFPQPVEGTYDSMNFSDLLDRAHIVINHCSNPAVDAIIAGVPVIVGEDSFCYDVSTSYENIENPNKPDRTEWCEMMAYTEWSEPEIAAGLPWQYLKKHI